MDVLMAAAEHLAQENASACSKAGSGKGLDNGLQEIVEQVQDSNLDVAENASLSSRAGSAKDTVKAGSVEGMMQKHKATELKEEQFENILLQLHGEAEVQRDTECADLKSSTVSLPEVEMPSSQGGDIFKVGDLVWAKVKSHPWWPGQIFDAADASKSAKKVQKPGRHLVAFFGDGTFGWLQQSQMLMFRPHFEDKVKQTTMKSFCKAVSEALEEVCRRAEVGSGCSCTGGFLHSRSTFPDANTGIQEMGLRIKHHPDISISKEMLSGERLVRYVKAVACSPFDHWSSSPEASQLRGHAFAVRTGLASIGKSNYLNPAMDVQANLGKSRSSALKREVLSEVAQQVEDNESKKANIDTDEVLAKLSSEDKCRSPIFENSRVCIQVQNSALKRKAIYGPGDQMLDDDRGCASSRSSHDTGQEVKGNKRSKQEQLVGSQGVTDVKSKKQTEDTETLFALGGFNTKLLKKVRKGSLCAVKEKDGLPMSVKKEHDDHNAKELQGSCTDEVMSEGTIEHSSQSDNKTREVQGSYTAESMSKCLMESTSHSECAFEVRRKVSSATFLTHKKIDDDSSDSCIDGKHTDPFPIKKAESLPTADEEEKFLNAGNLSASDSHVMIAKHPTASDHNVPGTGSRDLSAAVSHDEVHVDADCTRLELNKVSENADRIADEEQEGLNKVKLQPVAKKVDALEMTALVEGSVSVCVDQNVVKQVASASSELKDERPDLGASLQSQDGFAKNKASNILLNHLQGLKLLAKDPFNKAAMGKVDRATTAFMKFRDMMYQKSSGYAGPMRRSLEQDIRKRIGASQDLKLAVQKPQPDLQGVVSRSPKSHVHELLLAARKRKLEVLQEAAARKRKLEALQDAAAQRKTEGSQESSIKMSKQSSVIPSAPKRPQLLTVDSNIQKSTEQSQSRKNLGLNVNSLKESDNRRHSESPVGLLMKFSQDVALPSEAQLKATFARFGGLQTTGVRVFKDTASAQVVFKHGKDAEAALHYAKRKRLFGQAAVSYRLKQFQLPSVKVNQQSSLSAEMKALAKGNATSSAEIKAPVRAEESTPTLLHSPEISPVSNLTFSTERNPVLNPLPSNVIAQDFSSNVTENPIKSNLACKVASCNLDPKPTVNRDIQDEMMKLLQQLDVLVNLSC